MKQVAGIFLMCIFAIGAFAQEGERNNEKRKKKEAVEAKRIAFITNALGLTPTEAEKFWPIYNQREAERKALKKELKPNFKKSDLDNLSDAEVEKMILNGIELKQGEVEIEKKYFAEFKKVISVKQIAKLHRAEQRFKVEVVKGFQRRKGQNPDNRGSKGPR